MRKKKVNKSLKKNKLMIDFNLISRKPSQGHLDCVWIPGDCSLAKLTHKIIRISVSIYWVVIKAELLMVKCNVKNTGEIRESSCPLFGGQMRSDLPPFPWSHPLVFSGLGGTLAGQCYFSCVGCFGFTRGHGRGQPRGARGTDIQGADSLGCGQAWNQRRLTAWV